MGDFNFRKKTWLLNYSFKPNFSLKPKLIQKVAMLKFGLKLGLKPNLKTAIRFQTEVNLNNPVLAELAQCI